MIRSHSALRATTILSLTAALLVGCNNAKEGAVSGAGIGALSGLAIGSLSGNAGRGAAIGAIAGGVGGAVVGDQNRRNEGARAAAASNTAPLPEPEPKTVVVSGATPPPQGYATAQTIGRLVGNWRVAGTVESENGVSLPVSGTASGSVDKTYFVRVDIHLTDPRNGQAVEGTSMISQTGGRGIEMSNSFSTSPDVVRFRGEMDETGSLFTLVEASPSAGTRRIILRLSPGRDWAAEMWRGNVRGEALKFTPSS